MFVEGCQAKLGCSIVLSGPDLHELKQVRKALKQCLATARTLIEERLLLRFLVPDMKRFLLSSQDRILEEPGEDRDDEPELTFQHNREEASPGLRFSEALGDRRSSTNTNRIIGSLASRDSTTTWSTCKRNYRSSYTRASRAQPCRRDTAALRAQRGS